MSLKALCRGTLAVAALAALGAADARAQVAYTANTVTSVFYREFKKDGRFFVFNNPAAAAAFEQSGETGVGITRVGIGPNGETVFADNETALELFLFKYNVTAEVKRPAAPPLAVVWRDGKTRFTLGSAAYVEMSTRLQPRFTLRDARRQRHAARHRRARATARAASASAARSSSSRAGSTSRASSSSSRSTSPTWSTRPRARWSRTRTSTGTSRRRSASASSSASSRRPSDASS